jgi:hypothetical protein
MSVDHDPVIGRGSDVPPNRRIASPETRATEVSTARDTLHGVTGCCTLPIGRSGA